MKLESYFDKTTEIFGSPEVDKLLHDVSRLASELPVLTEAKQKPFPQVRSSMIPKSLVSGPEWSSKGDKGLPQRNSKGFEGEKVSVEDRLISVLNMILVHIMALIRKVPSTVDQVMEGVREKLFMGADHNLEMIILVVVKDTLRTHVRVIAAKVVRSYLLLLSLHLLLQQGERRLVPCLHDGAEAAVLAARSSARTSRSSATICPSSWRRTATCASCWTQPSRRLTRARSCALSAA